MLNLAPLRRRAVDDDGQNPPAVGADWSVLAVQPDLILRDPGFYDAQARIDSPAQNIRFSVSFVWLGSGTPGAQPYELYNADFSTRFSGQTLAVPEPSMPLLLALGGLGWILLRRALLKKTSPS